MKQTDYIFESDTLRRYDIEWELCKYYKLGGPQNSSNNIGNLTVGFSDDIWVLGLNEQINCHLSIQQQNADDGIYIIKISEVKVVQNPAF